MRPAVVALVTTASFAMTAAASSPPPMAVRSIRVCTYGGEGVCSQGGGAQTLDALRFLAPPSAGIQPNACSCLARCDQGVAIQLDSGEVVENVNGAREAAKLLRGLGACVDARLVDAFNAATRGDELMSDERPTEALRVYNRAFGLASAAGLGMRWRSRPSSVLRVRQRVAPGRPRAAGTPGSGTQTEGVSLPQVMWLAGLMCSRSRVFAALASQVRADPICAPPCRRSAALGRRSRERPSRPGVGARRPARARGRAIRGAARGDAAVVR